jgi:hypothetical protein
LVEVIHVVLPLLPGSVDGDLLKDLIEWQKLPVNGHPGCWLELVLRHREDSTARRGCFGYDLEGGTLELTAHIFEPVLHLFRATS